MDLTVLRNYIVVAREQNITRASKLIHITQPALSRQLFQLEEALGTKLFERSKYCIKLTEQGTFFYHRAEEILELYEKTKRDISFKEEEIAGELTIGAGEFRSVEPLSKIISEFQALYPKVCVHMRTGFTPDILEQLGNGLLDFGLIFNRPHDDRYASMSLGVKEEWGALVPKKSPIAEKKTLFPADLAEEPLLISGNLEHLVNLKEWFGPLGKCLNVKSTYNLLNNVAFLVANGVGIALCIRLNCSYRGLTFIPFTPPLHSETRLIWRNDPMQTPAKKAFITLLEKLQK